MTSSGGMTGKELLDPALTVPILLAVSLDSATGGGTGKRHAPG